MINLDTREVLEVLTELQLEFGGLAFDAFDDPQTRHKTDGLLAAANVISERRIKLAAKLRKLKKAESERIQQLTDWVIR